MSDVEVLYFQFQIKTVRHAAELFEIQRSPNGTTEWVTVGYDDNSEFIDDDLPVRSTWYYRVRKWSDDIEAWSSWSEPISATTSYVYDVRVSPAGAEQWTTVAQNVEGHEEVITDLNAGASYDVSVRAFDGLEHSDWSEPLSGTIDSSTADLVWIDPSESERLAGLVELVTETADDRVVFVRYRIGDRILGIAERADSDI